MKLVFDGRLNVEEQSVAGEKIDPEVMKILHEQNRRAYSKLNAILQKNGTVSLMVLMDEYGLGSGKPSTFLLNTLSHVRLDGACSKLGASFEGYPISNRKPGRSLSFKVA
jgi:hypothetical protein